MDNNKRNILLLVEGAKAEVKLFERITECFPEIKLTPDNIIVYQTNLWVLNRDLIKSFGKDWYFSDDIDFREYLKSKFPHIRHKKITDIFLVFDYERQDPLFDAQTLENMCEFFDDSVENGQLYINYPMIEAYKHLTSMPLPDENYKERKCSLGDLSNYKATVNNETKYQDLRKYDRALLQQIILHNIKKASYITENRYGLNMSDILDFCNRIDIKNITAVQNRSSLCADGFVYVLCTCVLFVCDYSRQLLFDP